MSKLDPIWAEGIEQGLNELRRARNNMSREEFDAVVRDLCKDPNLRYPLISAGSAALEIHLEEIKKIQDG